MLKNAPRKRAPRLAAHQRQAKIVIEATSIFATEGLSAPIRDLADKMGIRQALLYKYFPSKEALVNEVVHALFTTDWITKLSGLIADRTISLEDRLTIFLAAQLANEEEIAFSLFLRVALEGASAAIVHFGHLNEALVYPLIAELRHLHKLPTMNEIPLMIGERELSLDLYGSTLFYSIRRYIDQQEIAEDRNALIRFRVDAFLRSSAAGLMRLHNPSAPNRLATPYCNKLLGARF
jgi:AcrR family transcriptional regulator